MIPNRSLQSGFSLIVAIFILLAVALIIVSVVLTMSARSKSTALNLEIARAYYAANAGLDISVSIALSAGCSTMPAQITFEDFNVAITCATSTVNEGNNSYSVYSLSAKAQRGDNTVGNLVTRQLRANVSSQ